MDMTRQIIEANTAASVLYSVAADSMSVLSLRRLLSHADFEEVADV